MLKLSEIIFILFLTSLGTFLVLSQEESETEEEKQTTCKYLNTIRANYTVCCEYPLLVIWRWQYDLCKDKCEKDGESDITCCTLACGLNTLGVLHTATNNEGKNQIDVYWHGLVYSFLLSVGNDTQWTPVINETVQRCYNQFSETNEFDCSGRIPNHIFSIIECCYVEHFLKCAKWNPHGLKECEFTYKYVQKCSTEKYLGE